MWSIVDAGSCSKALLAGANTVMSRALLNVSTRLAFRTASAKRVRIGLSAAAVTTGSEAMPSKLPGPLAGTDPHPGPTCASAGDPAGGAAAAVPGGGAGDEPDEESPQAVSPAAVATTL